MARPDDDHVPQAILGDDGEVLAVAHVSPDAGPEALDAVRQVVDAVQRLMAETDTSERRAAAARSQERIRAIRERARRGSG